MSHPNPGSPNAYVWTPQPEAEAVVQDCVAEFLNRCPTARSLAERMHSETATRFVDWIDHVTVPAAVEPRLAAAGFTREPASDGTACNVHHGGMFPRFLISDDEMWRIAIKTDSVADFLAAQGCEASIEGEPVSSYRRVKFCACEETELWAVERHGYDGFELPPFDSNVAIRTIRHLEAFRTRRREFRDDPEGFAHLEALINQAMAELGPARTCDLFFAAEREYWQRRNQAAQVQKSRQDRLGLGWANHDHHTYRSSRPGFSRLIGLFERMGFYCRERFYAGREAGWGAQVLEHPATGIVIFADVDMSPDELLADFAHAPLPPRRELGTIGLWCALHGESLLEAGMHHLECQFDFDELRAQLECEAGIATMKPFADFPYLRQAFTEGERWPVRETRLARLLENGQITAAQAEEFRRHGALGSHLENLERNQGFKGFNQQGVNEIIAATDPRRQMLEARS